MLVEDVFVLYGIGEVVEVVVDMSSGEVKVEVEKVGIGEV